MKNDFIELKNEVKNEVKIFSIFKFLWKSEEIGEVKLICRIDFICVWKCVCVGLNLIGR